MSDSKERWHGTVTGIATYEVYHMDSIAFKRAILRAPMESNNIVEFSAKLLDDPSPHPQIHDFSATIEKLTWLSPGGEILLVEFRRDNGSWFQVKVTEDDATQFEVMS